MFSCTGVGREASLWILKSLAKMVVFLVLSGKKIFTTFGPTLENFWKNPYHHSPLPGKNPYDAHAFMPFVSF